ncbi:MAG: hypothetical protein LUE17_06685 [Planctomycetaceae bacterium]|nr:hypothetical protein [Planctomycetaceae bacterium]
MKKATGGVIKEAKALGRQFAIVGGLAVGAMAAIVLPTASAGDAAYKTAQKVGMSTEAWTKMAYAADQSGVTAEHLQKGLNKLNSQAIKAGRGSKEAAYWFQKLGIDIKDQDGKLKSSEHLMMEAADQLAGMEDGARKTGLAVGLFGEELGPKLIPFLNAGSDGIAALGDEAKRLGKTFTDDQGKASESFNDSLARVRHAITGVRNAIGNQLIPVLEPLLNHVQAFIEANREMIATKVGEWLERLQAAWPDILASLKSAWSGGKRLYGVIDSLVQRFGGWAKVLPYVGAALLAIKLWPLIVSVGVLTKAVAGLGIALLTTPIGWIALAVAGLAAGFVYLWKNCEGFRNFWIAMWEKVKSYVGDSIKYIKQAFDKGLIDGLLAIFTRFNPLRLITEAFMGVLSYVASLDLGFGPVVDRAVGVFASLGDGIKSAWDTGTGWLKGAVASLSGLFESFNLFDVGAKLFSGLWNGLKSIWTSIEDWFSGLSDKIASLIPDSLLALTDKVAGFAGGVMDTAGKAASAVGNAVSSVGSSIGGWLGGGSKASSVASVTASMPQATGNAPAPQESYVVVEFKNKPRDVEVKARGAVRIARDLFGNGIYNGERMLTP